jgi:hypothetical protein
VNRWILIFCGTQFVANCAGTETHIRMLEHDNAIRIEIAQAATYDYVVYINNSVDFGYDPDDPETRKKTALLALRTQCPQGQIVGERIIERGDALLRAAKTYAFQVKCNSGR